MGEVVLPRGVRIPEAELQLRAAKAGGPGGQHVNTTDSKVELRWDLQATSALTHTQRERVRDRLGSRLTADGVLILHGSEHRSQQRNRQAVIARFQALVGEALQPPTPRKRTRPSRASKRRRLDAKKRRGELKRLRRPPE